MDDLSFVYVLIFVDENISDLLFILRTDLPEYEYTGPGLLAGIDRGAEDKDWIRVVGERGMIAFTKDKSILKNLFELEVVVEYEARIILFANASGLSGQDCYDQLKPHWKTISRHFQNRGPWVIRIMMDPVKGSAMKYLSKRKLNDMLKVLYEREYRINRRLNP